MGTMNNFSQRVVVRWFVGLMIAGAGSRGWGADRPPASDQPWPVAAASYDEPDSAGRPNGVRAKTVPVTKGRAPANPVVASKTAKSVRPAASPASRTYVPQQPVGSGIRAAKYAQPAGKVRRTSGYVPLHEHSERIVGDDHYSADEVFEEVPGEIVVEESDGGHPLYVPETEAEMFFDDDCDACGGCGNCVDCCLIPCPPWGSLQAWVGTVGFTGPLNVGGTASFGFQEGINFGSRLPWGILPEIGWQVGVRFTQSDLSGSNLTDTNRNQTFLTAGLFRRVDQGLQFGVAFDLLQENWYGQADLTQVRGELAWVYRARTEYGVWWAVGGRERAPVANVPSSPGVDAALNAIWQPTDLYAGYIRRYFGTCDHGQARVFAGGSGAGDGLLGADAMLPMTDRWSFQAGFTYLIPEQSAGNGPDAGYTQESWNLGVSLVWIPGRPSSKNAFRPLMAVADNGSFLVNRR